MRQWSLRGGNYGYLTATSTGTGTGVLPVLFDLSWRVLVSRNMLFMTYHIGELHPFRVLSMSGTF